jgi:hypothetical protein
MKRKAKYTNEPRGKLRLVDDFLPVPEDLVFKEDNVKITMALSKPKANRGGWKTCSRGHKYRSANSCPICWPGGAKKKVKKGRTR